MAAILNSKPMLCHELVGRKHELQALLSCLQQAASGQPSVVMITGEAGLGKSRLCRVFMERSRSLSVMVLFGQAIRQSAALPFGPFLDALRSYFAPYADATLLSAPVLRAAFTPLIQLLPELAPLLTERALTLHDSLQTPLQQQQVLFQHVLLGLQSLAQAHHKPLLMVLEDLHWADETSLELLTFLAQRLNRAATNGDASSMLLIVGTYRTEVLPENPALQRLLVQLYPQRQISEMHLAPLNAAEHRQCLNSILDQPVSDEFANFLLAWDEGNPFLTEELLGAMATSGQLQLQNHSWLIPPNRKLQLPLSLTAAILERYVMLDPKDQEVLAYASVIGRTFDFPLLAALCKLKERKLVEVLRRAVLAQLICEVSSGQSWQGMLRETDRYQFRHALTREAIYDQMLTAERRLRHQAVAEKLEQLASVVQNGIAPARRHEEVTSLLVDHFWQAGQLEKVRPYALEEAERANKVFAFHEARYYLNIAQASYPEDSPERLDLLQRLGMVSLGIYDLPGAIQWLTKAKEGYQRTGQTQRALCVQTLLLLPNWLLVASPMPVLLAEVEATAEAVFADSNSTRSRDIDTIMACSQMAMWWTFDGHQTHVALWLERAFKLFDAVTDPQKEVAIQLSVLVRGWIKTHKDRETAEAGLAEMREVLHFAHQYSLPDLIIECYASLTTALIFLGRSDEADQLLEELFEYGRRSETPQFVFHLGLQHFFSHNKWETAIKLLREDIERTEYVNLRAYSASDRAALAHFLIARNELVDAQMHLSKAQPIIESFDHYWNLAQLWWGIAKLYAIQGNSQQAEAYYNRILDRWKTTEDTYFIAPILLDMIAFYTGRGALMKARQWLMELENIAHKTDNPVAIAALWESRGLVRVSEGGLEQAIEALRQAVDAWERLKRHYQQALASQHLAELLLVWATRRTVGRAERQAARKEAETLLDKASSVYQGLSIPTRSAEVKVLRTRSQLEAQRKRRRTLEARSSQAGLTQRELQILMHLAAGRTNREIATELNLSVGTVGVHVSHILTKLKCTTRTQAVSNALAKGWVNTVEEM